MDQNEFSFKALFGSADFIRRESIATKESFRNFCSYVDENVKNCDLAEDIQAMANECICAVYEAAFEQGFCFAVKAIKFILKI